MNGVIIDRELVLTAFDLLGKIVIGYKHNGKRFCAKLIYIERNFLVFETTSGEIIKNWTGCIKELTEYDPSPIVVSGEQV
jgi:hypothetical protein